MTFITKRRLTKLVSASAIVAVLAVAALPAAALASTIDAVTPSTNDINRTNGWAHVDVTAADGKATLTFTNPRAFQSCFEYRADGDPIPNSPTNYNPDVGDGLYAFTCVNNNTKSVTVDARDYVEVRMVFGAESDERFAWTKFDVPQPKCLQTGFVRDGINLTAAQIGGSVTGQVDASTCNIGVYIDAAHPGSVSSADISGANYYGVVVNGVAATVTNSTVHEIGEDPFNGAQHGNAILYINGASGTISDNVVYDFQKNGITVSGKAADGVAVSTGKTSATVQTNVVTGEGPIAYIAQNGIQISYGASATVKGNTVSGFNYTPTTNVATGLLIYQANGVKQSSNDLFDNEVNLYNGGKGGGNVKP